jgi:hypothetical protein
MKTIDINAKEWFDKVNGNSYFCGTVTLNYGMKNEETFLMPFQYGYGSQYEWEAKGILTYANKISTQYETLYSYCKRENIILRSNIIRGCKKRELKEIEKEYNENLQV